MRLCPFGANDPTARYRVQPLSSQEQCNPATGSPVVSFTTRTPRNDRYETHEPLTTPLLQQRREQASAYYRQQIQNFSRPSSSSGASAASLRRTSRLPVNQPSRLRSSSADSPPARNAASHIERSASTGPPSFTGRNPRQTLSEVLYPPDYKAHPALRISGRTHSAILYALEEAVRTPNPFTPDWEEENAQMSDLGGGRTSNGGPVPVSTTPATLRTPRDVMRNRREREAKRQEETRLEEQRRQQQLAEERRQSAERRAAAATGEPRYSAASSQYTPDLPQGNFPGQRLSSGAQVASGADYGVPTGRAEPVPGRVTTQAQNQPRPAQSTQANTSRRPQPARQRQQQPFQTLQAPQAAADTKQGAQSQAQPAVDPPQGSRASSFPHAFERWEQLSAHWEGLTSYWLRRLEADAEEITRTVPTATAMSRQINDLSAAGANLFHAVVELQRLRASSERKFQRWFFETRADIERNAEIRAELEKQLQEERSERQRSVQTRADTDNAVENARTQVEEMRRELMISKEEARRAWEELGRRNQESLELAESLKAGRMTIVSGVQVMPIFGGPTSRTTSAGHRPQTRENVQYDTPGVTTSGAAGLRSPGDEQGYYEQDLGDSPTNTDPFVENRPVLHHEPAVQSLATGTYSPFHPQSTQTAYPSSAAHPATTTHAPYQPSSTHATPRGTHQSTANVTAAQAERFYQQTGHETFLHSPEAATQQHRQQQATSANIADTQTESSDWDAEGDPQRQREYEERYGLGGPDHPTALTQIPPEAPTVPATSADAMADYGPTLGAEEHSHQHQHQQLGEEYEGGEGLPGWEQLRAPHHPTRLSDVPEEDEERSSRRTAV